MARQILILGKSTTEANEYARAVGLERFSYRAVRSAGAIRGVRNAEVHILPSFTTRPDRHAILSVLQWAASLDVFYVDPADFKPVETEASNALETGTPPTDEEIEAAYAEHAEREAALAPSNAELTAPFEPTRTNDAAVAEPAPAPKPPRRSRAPKTPAAPAADFFA